MEFVRTPEQCFDNLYNYPFEPNYTEVSDLEGGVLRMHYLDEGPRDGEVVLCMHGQPSWSYLYRNMIPILTKAGLRCIAPDLVGFGKSDKPTSIDNYTYANHVAWVGELVKNLSLSNITIIGQDWGGLIGLRVVAENPELFARIVCANTALPTGFPIPEEMQQAVYDKFDQTPALPPREMMKAMASDASGMGFFYWVKHCAEYPDFDVTQIIQKGDGSPFPEAVRNSYAAPFPDDSYMAGARKFPTLVPILPNNVAIPDNKAAWKVLSQWQKPFITANSDNDPVTAGSDKVFQERVPGAKGQKHVTINGGGHFLQDERAQQLSDVVINFIEDNPV
ncbi:MAG: haloalkane dehalogenase [Halieaceae bacterium]|jgi:haloalkane dehalogenase|nr:haloalkane dehalogenase [Halieaceae bacterium]